MPTEGEHGRQVQRMFERITPRYDLLNRLLSAGFDQAWRRKVTRLLPPTSASILDVGTGTADLAIAIAQSHRSSPIIGVDFSMNMLRAAFQKSSRIAESARLRFLAADAIRLPFPEATFDGVTCAFVIRNIRDKESALREFWRVLRPGGTAVILELTNPRGGIASGALRWYLHSALPFIGSAVSGDREAYRYLPASMQRFLTIEETTELMVKSGFSAVRARRLTLGVAALFSAVRP